MQKFQSPHQHLIYFLRRNLQPGATLINFFENGILLYHSQYPCNCIFWPRHYTALLVCRSNIPFIAQLVSSLCNFLCFKNEEKLLTLPKRLRNTSNCFNFFFWVTNCFFGSLNSNLGHNFKTPYFQDCHHCKRGKAIVFLKKDA